MVSDLLLCRPDRSLCQPERSEESAFLSTSSYLPGRDNSCHKKIGEPPGSPKLQVRAKLDQNRVHLASLSQRDTPEIKASILPKSIHS